jgi:hypothetical protein
MKIIEGQLRVAASDVANFLACQKLTQLDLRAARRTLRPLHAVDLSFEDLVRRGEEHERGGAGAVPASWPPPSACRSPAWPSPTGSSRDWPAW